MKKRIVLFGVLLAALTACGKNEVAESTTEQETTVEITTEATTEATTEVTTEELNEAQKQGYDKTYIHKTDMGGNYAIPEKFNKTNEENVETGLWYEFTDSGNNIVLETWEDSKRYRKQDYLKDSKEKAGEDPNSVIEDNKVRYTGTNEEGKCFIEIDIFNENVYHFITITFDDGKQELCNEIADIVEAGSTFDKVEGVSGKVPLLLYGGVYGISDEELNTFTDEEVVEAINEIYALNGLIFEEQDLVDYFKEYTWYAPTVAATDFTNSLFDDKEKENLDKLRSRVDYTPSGVPTGGDVSAYDVETIRNKIIEHYTVSWAPEGEYEIFDTEETNSDTEYTGVMRYQMSDAEQQERIDGGGIPLANVYVCKVTVNKLTGEVTTDTGDSWFME
ncbi:MAG: YARHG domain-containing protein [Eubacterium sp.]|nr:YARHG domain-containing protein [Eubacterium sp.]